MKKYFRASQPLNCLLYVDWNVIIIYDNNKSNKRIFLGSIKTVSLDTLDSVLFLSSNRFWSSFSICARKVESLVKNPIFGDSVYNCNNKTSH